MKMLGDTLFASITNFKHLEKEEPRGTKSNIVNTTDDTVFMLVHKVKLV